jgi:hypothetical protein
MTIASGGGSTTSPQSTSNEGFNTGAKAGVGVSAALVAIIAILGIWFCLRQRRRRREQRAQHDLEITPAREHELGTSANTHEIDGKNAGNVAVAKKKFPFNENVAELSTPVTGEKSLRKAGVLEKPPLPEMGSTEKAIVRKDVAAVPELHAQPDVHEMPAVAAATNVGSDWEQLGASELDSEPAMIYHNASELPVSSHSQAALASPLSLMAFVGPGSSSSITAVHSTNTAAGAPVEDKLDILRQRIDRVREDKERLEKIQQLKDLEAELQREIMAEQTTVGDVV